ncbi:hypothetical protein [Nitrospira sp. Nam80]
MDHTAQDMLAAFADTCPRPTLGEDDWERLYYLALYLHRRGLNTEHRTIRNYLIERGCSMQKASWISAQYRHFRRLLALYDAEHQTQTSVQQESPQSGRPPMEEATPRPPGRIVG